MKEELKQEYNITKFYKYKEIKSGKRIEFGWEEGPDVKTPAIISKQTDFSDATSVEDYKRYFNSLLGKSLSDVIGKHSGNYENFLDEWKQKYPQFGEIQGEFVFKIFNLIDSNMTFEFDGRKYFIIGE